MINKIGIGKYVVLLYIFNILCADAIMLLSVLANTTLTKNSKNISSVSNR